MTPRKWQWRALVPEMGRALERQTRAMQLWAQVPGPLKPLERERAEPLRMQAVMLASQPRLPM
jgi:hypothetical protein